MVLDGNDCLLVVCVEWLIPEQVLIYDRLKYDSACYIYLLHFCGFFCIYVACFVTSVVVHCDVKEN